MTPHDHEKMMNEQVKANVTVVTPDLPKLPFVLENGVKVFQLTAEVVEHRCSPSQICCKLLT